MHTRVVPASQRAVEDAKTVIEAHIPVVVPTETVYGLAARYDDEKAIRYIFVVKGRPADNPLIVHVANIAQAEQLCEVTENARKLMKAYWPGPLSFVLKSKVDAPWTTAGLPTIAIRMPENTFLQQLITTTGPLAAPSANKSGTPSPTTAQHCLQDFSGELPLIIDGGECKHGLESTVLDCTTTPVTLLRPGAVTREELEKTLSETILTQESSEVPKAPGMKYRHYAPKAFVEITKDPHIRALQLRSEGNAVFVISTDKDAEKRYMTPQELGKHVYAWMREADEQGYNIILLEPVEKKGIGAAVMNRLEKAAKHS